MILILGILLLLTVIATFIVCFVVDNMHRLDYHFIGAFNGLALMIAIGCFICYFIPPITPIDVYQGKTTLKYEVVNGIKVDSTVIWKEEQ